MASKRILTAAVLFVAVSLAACDNDKAQGGGTSDVAGLDSSRTATKAQKDAPGDQKSAEPAPERTTASSPSNGTVAEQPPLDLTDLLHEKDFEKIYRGSLDRKPLVGKAPSPDYNAVHLQPAGRNFYGAGLQVWRVDDAGAAEDKVNEMREQYLGVQAAPKDAPLDPETSFVSKRGGIANYVFAFGSDEFGYVAAVSCGEKLCGEDYDKIFQISKTVAQRLEQFKDEERDRPERKKPKR